MNRKSKVEGIRWKVPASKLQQFWDLKVGNKFIILPIPGDDHGHGGFRGTHFIFIKTSYLLFQDNARKLNSGASSNIPAAMFVICVA